MKIRHAAADDLDVLAAIEAASYPAAEAGSRESIKGRLEHFPNTFWLLEDDDRQVLAFISGMYTSLADLRDDMYHHPELQEENGGWLMIFSVVTDPGHRGGGCASRLMKQVIQDVKAEKRKGIVLTCKEKLIDFYARFGYVNEGVSASTHGDAVWYQMRLTLEQPERLA